MTSQTLEAPATPKKRKAAVPVSWNEYLTGKKVAADRFLAAITKSGIPVPTPVTLDDTAAAVREKPERVQRMVALLQAAAAHGQTVREVALKLAEAALTGLELWPVEECTVESTALVILQRANKRPLPASELGALFLLLQVGAERQMVDEASVRALLENALTPPARTRARHAPGATAAPSPLSALLAVEPAAALLAPALRVHAAMTADAERLRAESRSTAREMERLAAERAAFRSELERTRAEVEALRAEKAAADAKIDHLQAQVVDLHDGYRHELRELRERALGVLEGQLTRWLRTGLAAGRAEPPRMPVVEERLEDALNLIESEIAWLQASV